MAKKMQHGGKRPGAGRKPSAEGRSVVVTASVPETLVAGLDELAEAEDWNRSKAVTEAIRALLKRRKRA